jgi:HlyD family secretion protein
MNLIFKYRYIVIGIAVLLVGIGGYILFFSGEESSYNSEKVKIGDVVREVSVIGQIKKGEELELGFKESGEIKNIYVKKGDEVEEGQELIKLDADQLYIQLQEAQANLDLVQAELDKLIAGATEEEIRSAETKVSNAQVTYEDAKNNLENIERIAENNLESAYEDALNVLETSYLKISNAYADIDSIQREYFSSNDQISTNVKQQKNIIQDRKSKSSSALVVARNGSYEDIDDSLSEFNNYLNDIYSALEEIRDDCESIEYRDTVSATDKTTLDNHKSYINTEIVNVVNSRQNISSTKLTNSSNIDTAQSQLSSAEGSLNSAEDNLALITADPRQEDIDLYQARVNQARAQTSLLKDKIKKAVIRAPLKGQIGDIKKEEGEQVTIAEPVVSLIPDQPFQIDINVPEADVGKIEVGNDCEISLDAFPEFDFDGKILEIDPMGTVISGVVYYESRTSINTSEKNIKPGMTADVTIISGFKEDVLTIPWKAVEQKEGKEFVKVIVDGEFKEKEIETGLRGSEGRVEILSGIKEGEEVVTYIKEEM